MSLDDARKLELQQQYGLSYHIDYALLAEQLVGLKGKRVLEVGGSLPAGFVCDELAAAQWVAVEETDYWAETLSTGHVLGTPPRLGGDKKYFSQATAEDLEPYRVCYGRIEELPVALEGCFDVVFSIAAFEHIAKLPLALDKMYRALGPAGKLFSLFAPIWSAYNGHHLPEIVDKAGNHFNFASSPIPPWGHLLLSQIELYDLLCRTGDRETAQEILYFVHASPHINRFFLEDYLNIVARSPFVIEQMTPMFQIAIPAAVQNALTARYPGKNFSYSGLLLVLKSS